MKEIKLNRDKVAFVDDGDYERASKFKWYTEKRGINSYNYYAKRKVVTDGKESTQSLHIFIMNGTIKGLEIDHKNGNGLDCQRENLRRCTHSQNMSNQRKKPFASTRFKGVSYNKKLNKYSASIKKEGRSICIGNYNTEIEAAYNYDQMAYKMFGQFARYNILNVTGINYIEYGKFLMRKEAI